MIYISYEKRDGQFANKLRRYLSSVDEVIVSSSDILPGEDIINNIYSNIKKASVVIFIISKYSENNSFILNQISLAVSIMYNTKSLRIVPIYIGNVNPPVYLSNINGIVINNINKNINYEDIKNKISNKVELLYQINNKSNYEYIANETKLLRREKEISKINTTLRINKVMNIISLLLALVSFSSAFLFLLNTQSKLPPNLLTYLQFAICFLVGALVSMFIFQNISKKGKK